MEEAKSTELGRKQGTTGVNVLSSNLVLPSVIVVDVIVKKHISLYVTADLSVFVNTVERRQNPARVFRC